MGVFVMLESSLVMLAPWHNLSAYVKANDALPFEATRGKDLWSYAAANPAHNTLFNKSMTCDARVNVFLAILEGSRDIFNGVESLFDVGGGNGTCLSILVKACPWIRGINFALPHVVSASPKYKNVQHVGGNMFDYVPKADVAFLKWLLYDWDGEECIKILKKCKEAVPKKTGKVIIVEAVIEQKQKSKWSEFALMLDMVIMAHTNKGKERTRQEWAYVIEASGFKRHTITPIQAIQSINHVSLEA